MRKRIACIIVMLLLLTQTAFGQALPKANPEKLGFEPARLNRIDNAINEWIDQGAIPGAVALVARHGTIAYYKSFGMKDVAAGKPMQLDTIFRIASMSKPITCTAVMLLYEEGNFLLTDPVSNYIPEFINPKVLVQSSESSSTNSPVTVPAKQEITIRHLLNHTAGISYGRGPHQKYYRDAGIPTALNTNRRLNLSS